MQELRLVAVSEDGSYLVVATAGRGTRFTLPVDDRLRAVVRGQFSRLGQYEIEVESPLRPKEIQARIRAGETAEQIADSAGIPVQRVRWFEGPVLQEREYVAQQAQRVAVRQQGEQTPGPPLGEIVEERLGRRGVDLEETEWDSWKRDDGTWKVRVTFFVEGNPGAAEWSFDARRRHVAPLDEEAARLSAPGLDDQHADVTPLLPRRPPMTVVAGRQEQGSTTEGKPGTARDDETPPARRPVQTSRPAEKPETPPAAEARPAARPAADQTSRQERAKDRQRTARAPKPAARPDRQSRPKRASAPPPAAQEPAVEVPEEVAEQPAAAAAGAEQAPPARRKASARGRRASVPSWDEIMFGARRPE